MALTAREEAFLRQEIKNSTPMPVMNPSPNPGGLQPAGGFLRKLEWELAHAPKMPVQDINDGYESKLWGILKPGEKMGQFYARTGLGLAQIRAMTVEQIRRFIAVAEQTASDGIREPTSFLQIAPNAKPRPVRAVMVGL